MMSNSFVRGLDVFRRCQSQLSVIPKASSSSFQNFTDEKVHELLKNQAKGHEKCINSVTLLGRVGSDPQLRGTDANPVVCFPLATNLRYKSEPNEEYKLKTEWHNIAVFRAHLRESVHQNVNKGHRVLVQGKIVYGAIEDKLGVIRHTTTIMADDVIRFAH